jgi:hypothetical protein
LPYTQFFVNLSSDTSADTLVALGWADLLQTVCSHLGRPDEEIIIERESDSYVITLSHGLRLEQLISEQVIPFLDPLITAKQGERQAKKGRTFQDGFDYEDQREKQHQFFEQRKKSKERDMVALAVEGLREDLVHYQAINMMKVPDTFNEIVLHWQGMSAQQQWLTIGLLYQLFSAPENDVEAARKTWDGLAKKESISGKAQVTAVQLVNPTTGKGSNSPKSDKLTSGGLDNFWLLELLKFKGFMLGAAPYTIRGSKDRKTYVVQPAKVALRTLTQMMNDFRKICWSSTVTKLDILATLRLAEVLVKHRRTELEGRAGLEEWEEGPIVSIARGFDVAFYKDMGSAHATMNVSTINIPTWLPPVTTMTNVDEVDLFLQEHLRVIRRIEGYQGKEGNDEVELLRTYRDFLSGHNLYAFWTFAALYGGYLFRQREHEKNSKLWLPQLTKKGLDFLVMHNKKQDLAPISQNAGFQHIASAIREATVRAQRRYTQENDNRYEVRYGLGQELLRKARYRDDFTNALNEFLFLYNAETAREEEKVARKLQRRLTGDDYRQQRLRYPVTTADIDQLNSLLDTYPTELIAKMLISYGYARLEMLRTEELETNTVDNELVAVADAETE